MTDTINLDAAKKIVSVQGLDHYHKKASTEISSDIMSKVSNPNLLINPDFAINQRGLSEYSGTGVYTVDCWKTYNLTKVSCNNGYIKISSTNNTAQHGILQLLETPEKYAGKRIAITVNSPTSINGEAGNGVRVIEVSNGVTNVIKAFGTSDEQITAIYDIPADATQLYVRFYIRPTESGDQMAFLRWIKLEVGSMPTPFVPPDTSTELLKCQRYFVEYNTAGKAYANIGAGTGWSNNRAFIFAALPAPFRAGINPTIAYSGAWVLTSDNFSANDISVSKIEAAPGSNSTNRVAIVCTGEGVVPGTAYMLRAGNNAAARLSLSAEL